MTPQFWLDLANARALDWDAIAARLPFADDMKACIQDTVFHAEGDVWTHTRMVVEQLQTLRSHAGIADAQWPGVLLAALLHDIAKPHTRGEEIDPASGRTRITHKGHARAGAVMAWGFLWREGVPREIREQVFHLIAWHQKVFFATFSSHLENDVIQFAEVGRWRQLLALAEADTRGRIGPNTDETVDTLSLLRDEVSARDLLDKPWPFASDQARVWYCAKRGRSAYYDPPAPQGSRVIVLCGLPGAGKDTYCRADLKDLPVVSLDQWRETLDIAPDETQGAVIQAAMEEARGHLRAKRPFVWNATHISRLTRDKAVGLCLDYDAHVEIHAIDPAPDVLFRQNKGREKAVPEAVIERLIGKWEPPSRVEAHRVVWLQR
jgi:putative nucleotidyltransferase with HDIG domain